MVMRQGIKGSPLVVTPTERTFIVRVVLNPKLQSATVNYAFDFSSMLAIGETPVSQSVTASVYSGVDASPSSIVNGSATYLNGIVTQSLTAGVAGVIYEVLCTMVTSASQTLKLSAYLAVVPDLQ